MGSPPGNSAFQCKNVSSMCAFLQTQQIKPCWLSLRAAFYKTLAALQTPSSNYALERHASVRVPTRFFLCRTDRTFSAPANNLSASDTPVPCPVRAGKSSSRSSGIVPSGVVAILRSSSAVFKRQLSRRGWKKTTTVAASELSTGRSAKRGERAPLRVSQEHSQEARNRVD